VFGKAFSEMPPPPGLEALLDGVSSGRGLYLYIRQRQTTGSGGVGLGALRAVTAEDARSFFAWCGYRLPTRLA
jgi:hypothetical protein